ncbi:zinc ribbon-containing protein [Vibrio sp. WJH972]
MPKRSAGYVSLLETVINKLKINQEDLEDVVQTSEKVAHAASDMTKDELSLISAYVQADLNEFAQSYEESKSGPFYLMIENSIWQGLAEISDKTFIEQTEFFHELETQGTYQTGDIIGLGTLGCEKCGHRVEYNHPTAVSDCTECGNHHFRRLPIKP